VISRNQAESLVWGTGLARFERATYRLGGGRSILLSYSPKSIQKYNSSCLENKLNGSKFRSRVLRLFRVRKANCGLLE
jgi:hypothetical protein